MKRTISDMQFRKARQLSRAAVLGMRQAQTISASARETDDSVMAMEVQLRAMIPRYEVVAEWWRGVQDKGAAARTQGGHEWAKLESARVHLEAAIDEAKRESARLRAEAARLNQLYGPILEIVRAVAEYTQCSALLRGGSDADHIIQTAAGA